MHVLELLLQPLHLCIRPSCCAFERNHQLPQIITLLDDSLHLLMKELCILQLGRELRLSPPQFINLSHERISTSRVMIEWEKLHGPGDD
jgi:hypothetical protein